MHDNFNSVKYHLAKLTATSLAGISGQWSTSRVQAHMEHPSFVSVYFIKRPFGVCSGTLQVFTPSGRILLPSLAVFECIGAVFFSLPPPTLPSIFPSTDSISVDVCLEWGLMAGLQGFTSHGGSILSRGWLPTVEAPGYPKHP